MVTRNIQLVYSGGSNTPISSNIANTGQSAFSVDTICAGSATTTLAPLLITDPDTNCRCFCFLASGNCTLHFDLTSGTDTSIALTANVAQIFTERPNGTIDILPTSSDTMTLKVANAGSSTITFFGDMLFE